MTFSYDAGELATEPLYQLRLLIGDTDSAAVLLQDEELQYLLDESGSSVNAAGAKAARRIVARFSRLADQTAGRVSVSYSQLVRHYVELAEKLEGEADEESGIPRMTGMTLSERETEAANTDLVQPVFGLGIHDDMEGTA